jgi:hypothetical protein
MPRRPAPSQEPTEAETRPASADATADDGAAARSSAPSLAGLGIAGISRRRIAWTVLVIAAAWIVLGFADQAVEASRANARVAQELAVTAGAAAETDALRRELALVQQERWVLQQARAYQLGSSRERPFALDPSAPALPDDAPGPAVRRIGAEVAERTPLEAWLEVLFGPPGG